jgi:hypothetical protein
MVDVEPSILGKFSLVNIKWSVSAEGSVDGDASVPVSVDGASDSEADGAEGPVAPAGPLPLQANRENISTKKSRNAVILFIILLQTAWFISSQRTPNHPVSKVKNCIKW